MPTSHNLLPLHVTFRGMPQDRWWDFEDSVTDFGQLDAEHVQRYLRRTRWTDGSTLVWMARQAGPGRGPGSSGLRFDFLRAAPGAGASS